MIEVWVVQLGGVSDGVSVSWWGGKRLELLLPHNDMHRTIESIY